jgi:hypothetical protein
MNSLFILNINGNSFLSQIENYIEKLSQFCPLLEIIDDVRIGLFILYFECLFIFERLVYGMIIQK